MIGFLRGKIIFKGLRHAVVDVDGVGYKVYAPAVTLHDFKMDDQVKLWTHLHVREDAMELYGFLNQSEMEFFEALISISGIGPRSALGVMALATVDILKKAVSAGDTSYLTKVSGIGRKTAEKIVLELKDKFGPGVQGFAGDEFGEDADVLDALVSLGYSQRDAREVLKKVPENIRGREARIKEALKKVT